MHTDDHILQSFLAAKGPLPTIALDLGMTLIALVQWIDRNADLLAVAKRAMETHIAFLTLRAEAAALIDLTQVSTSTTNEERKRKSASQLLRHSAKRVLPQRARSVSDGPSAHALADLAGSLERSAPPPSPRPSGEKSPSEAREMRDASMSHDAAVVPSSTNPERVLRAPCASAGPADLLHKFTPSSPPNAECPVPNAAPFSDHEIDVLMVTLARHFDIDLTAEDTEPEADAVASSVGGGPA